MMGKAMRFFRLDDDHPFTGWHMLAVIVAFFGTVITVNMVMAFFATGTFPGLVVANSYVASQNYNELLEKARAQDAAGWQHGLETQDGIVRFTLADRSGEPVTGLDVSARIGRPSSLQYDREFPFVARDVGAYETEEALPPGMWEVDLEAWQSGELLFRRTEDIFVRPPEQRS